MRLTNAAGHLIRMVEMRAGYDSEGMLNIKWEIEVGIHFFRT
jgi:hypothetical protein